MTEVINYKYVWDLTDRSGHLKVRLKGKSWSKWLKHTDACEFQIIISSLRNEKPIFYGKNKHGRYFFQTMEEPVGDGEL